MLEGKCVRIDGKAAKPSLKVKPGIRVEGIIPEDEPILLIPQPIPLDILYEDQYMLAVNKAPGMVVHPSFGHAEGTLVNAVLAYLQGSGASSQGPGVGNRGSEIGIGSRATTTPGPRSLVPDYFLRPGIVHRLDKGTSGVIIVAKDSKTQEMLSSLFKNRDMEKTYRAIVEGTAQDNSGVINGNIGRHRADRKRMAVLREGGRDALTVYRVVERLDRFTHIEVHPKTGRTHQIRVHLAHIGHPVVGDEVYGKKARHLTPRPLLHAHKISFVHPFTRLPVIVEAPIPEDITEFVNIYRKDIPNGQTDGI